MGREPGHRGKRPLSAAEKWTAGFLRRLAKKVCPQQIIIALDTAKGKVTIHGWRKRLALQAEKVMTQLEPFCAGFLCTDVDREGTMTGANLEWFAACATPPPIQSSPRAASKRGVKLTRSKGGNGRRRGHGHVQQPAALTSPLGSPPRHFSHGVIWQAPSAASAQIRVRDVLLNHALRIEERSVDGDGVLHHLQNFARSL